MADKYCPSCELTKDSGCFNKDSTRIGGLACYCKECNSLINKQKYLENSQNHAWKLTRMLKASKTRAVSKGLEHTLTFEELVSLYPVDNQCPILGLTLSWGMPKSNSPSLDRIDSSKGYTVDNCQIISNRANTIKHDATVEELELLVNYLKGL